MCSIYQSVQEKDGTYKSFNELQKPWNMDKETHPRWRFKARMWGMKGEVAYFLMKL
jgi:hypothetical protein